LGHRVGGKPGVEISRAAEVEERFAEIFELFDR
jgi:hypothetical protein